MKNMKKLLQKAMVFTLAVAMLAGTPLTASAAGLSEIYKTDDGWGNTVGKNDENDTRTGTVTSTTTNTDSRILDVDATLEAIVLSETEVNMEMDGAYNSKDQVTYPLTVEFVWSDDQPHEEERDLVKRLKWETSDRNIVSLNNPNKNGDLSSMDLVAKAGGEAKVTVSLNSYANNIHKKTTANVVVKQYATTLDFEPELDNYAYEGASLDLADYLIKDPKTASDEVTYEVVRGNGTIKNGVLKLGKINANKPETKSVTIIAIGEHKKSANRTIPIKTAVPATKVAITKADEEGNSSKDVITKYDWLVNKEKSNYFKVVLDTKEKKGIERKTGLTVDEFEEFGCTDTIKWTVTQKSDIIKVVGDDKGDLVKLQPLAVGTATVTAQASSGKKGTLKVTVRADLTGLTITTDSTTLYSGQTIKLNADQYFGTAKDSLDQANVLKNFTDAGLTWKFDDSNKDEAKKMKNVASINAKTGVLTIKPDVTNIKDDKKPAKIVVTATNAKAIGNRNLDGEFYVAKGAITPSNTKVEFGFKQIDVTEIVVYKNTKVDDGNILASAKINETKKKFITETNRVAIQIPYDASRTYAVLAKGTDDDGNEIEGLLVEDALNWTSSNEKAAIASRDDGKKTGKVEGVKKGNANIKISSACKMSNGKYKAITATIKTQITAPTKYIKLSAKNSAIAATGKNQTVTVKATLEKGSTSKTNQIEWTADIEYKNGESKHYDKNAAKNGKIKLEANDYAAGDRLIVTARIPSAGVQSKIYFDIVMPSTTVEIRDGETNENVKDMSIFTVGTKKNNAVIKLYDDDTTPEDVLNMVTAVNIGGKKEAERDWQKAGNSEYHVAKRVYTVNKKGIVQIVGDEVKGIKPGTVKITATTQDGKKATLTVKVE